MAAGRRRGPIPTVGRSRDARAAAARAASTSSASSSTTRCSSAPTPCASWGWCGWRRIGLSYCEGAAVPYRPARNLEQFFINRFGRELYLTFFKSYTEKVWGVPCDEISAEWGAQRIKGLSITTALTHFLRRLVRRSPDAIAQSDTETSLIEQFLYPEVRARARCGRLVADEVRAAGWPDADAPARRADCTSRATAWRRWKPSIRGRGETTIYRGDYFFSTMPIQDLVQALAAAVPAGVREVADGLIYRDFITVGLLLDEVEGPRDARPAAQLIATTGSTSRSRTSSVGRLQIFNNWSPYLVADPVEGLDRAGVLLLRGRRPVATDPTRK